MFQQVHRLNGFVILVHVLTGGRAYRGSPTSLAGFLELTTTGRRTGLARTVPLIYIRDGSTYVVVGSNGGKPHHPSWVYNLQSHPQVSMHVHNRHLPATAEVAEVDKRQELWDRLLAIAPFYARFARRTQRDIPLIILRPQPEQVQVLPSS